MKVIYHGSKDIIVKPIYGYGKKYNDYGLGFYCTEDINLAKEWAVDYNRNGAVNIYLIEEDELNILDLCDKKYSILNWLAILLENRYFEIVSPLAFEAEKYILENFALDYKKYDAIIGYRADDSYFSFALDFLSGSISLRQLSNAMKLGKLGKQFVLISKKAFSFIKYIGNDKVLFEEWYNKKNIRDKKARHDYFYSTKNKRKPDDLFITDIIDLEIGNDDERLR